MKPVMQTRFGFPAGNCYAACIASILEISIEEAEPCAAGNEQGEIPQEQWHAQVNQFLKERGYWVLGVRIDQATGVFPIYAPPPGSIIIVGGQSPRGDWKHAVLGMFRTSRIAENQYSLNVDWLHDPHPDGTFLTTVEDFEVLVPLNAGKMKEAA